MTGRPGTSDADAAPSRRDGWWSIAIRTLLAGPGALALTVLVFAGMPSWLPKGAGGVDHIAFPLFFLPAIWAVIFFYALLDRRLARVAVVMGLVAVIQLMMLKDYLFG